MMLLDFEDNDFPDIPHRPQWSDSEEDDLED